MIIYYFFRVFPRFLVAGDASGLGGEFTTTLVQYVIDQPFSTKIFGTKTISHSSAKTILLTKQTKLVSNKKPIQKPLLEVLF